MFIEAGGAAAQAIGDHLDIRPKRLLQHVRPAVLVGVPAAGLGVGTPGDRVAVAKNGLHRCAYLFRFTQRRLRSPIAVKRNRTPFEISSMPRRMPRTCVAAERISARIMMPSTSDTMPERSTQPHPVSGRSEKDSMILTMPVTRKSTATRMVSEIIPASGSKISDRPTASVSRPKSSAQMKPPQPLIWNDWNT